MSGAIQLLELRRLILSVAVLLALAGAMAYSTMPRTEDPKLPYRFGMIVTAFPGADAETVERLVLEPLEDRLAEVNQINTIEATCLTEVAIVSVEFYDAVTDTDTAWDDVREAVNKATEEFPEGVLEPRVDDELFDTDSIVYIVTGSPDPLELKDAAEDLRRAVLGLSMVKRSEIIGDPGEQIVIEYDDSVGRRLNVNARLVAASLQGRNNIIPGGTVKIGDKASTVRPHSEFRTIEEIASTAVVLGSGAALPLEQVATIRRSPQEPTTSRVRINGEPGVAVAIVAQNEVNLLEFGAQVRETVDRLRPQHEPLKIDEVIFQPRHVEARLDNLGLSLATGIAIVAGVLFIAMGLRMGLVVSLIVPLVTLASLAVYAGAGGILHQMSISAFVLALGMLVDNAIVVAENIQDRLDRGEGSREAASNAIRELLLPLGTATGTTLAAFVPMLLAEGPTGDFTRAIPVIIMLTLAISYIFAAFVTPSLSTLVLKGDPNSHESRFKRFAGGLARVSVGSWPVTMAVITVIMGGTLYAAQFVRQQFFPLADRAQVVVDLQLPEGSHIDAVDAISKQLERDLLDREDVTRVQAYVGRGAPRFYYNLPSVPTRPNFAQLIVNTTSLLTVSDVLQWLRGPASARYPEVNLTAQTLEQGPPVGEPIQVRLYGWDLDDLKTAGDDVLAELRQVPGTISEKHNLSLGSPMVNFTIDDASAARRGMTRADVALSILGRTRGIEVGQFRGGRDPIPIVVRSSLGENLPVDQLPAIDAAAPRTAPVPLSQVAAMEVEWRPAAIRHRNRQRIVTVSSQLQEGVTFSEILADLQPRMDGLDLPDGVTWEFGGEVEGSSEANSSILSNLPFALMLLIGFLLFEFNSFRRTAIVFSTVPLAATGVVPGLLFSGQPFGFMSLLGVIALVGIVVNNAIVLLDVVESERDRGLPIPEALQSAVKNRVRPILLTTATTVAGLMPLALSPTTLWPPLAWAMISGLLASTVLTLFVVPAQYRLFFWFQERRERLDLATEEV